MTKRKFINSIKHNKYYILFSMSFLIGLLITYSVCICKYIIECYDYITPNVLLTFSIIFIYVVIIIDKMYKNVYNDLFIKLNHYLERFKIYKQLQRIGGNSYNSAKVFHGNIRIGKFKDLTLIGFFHFILHRFMLGYMLYVSVNVTYNNINITLILFLVIRIMRYWNHRLYEIQNK